MRGVLRCRDHFFEPFKFQRVIGGDRSNRDNDAEGTKSVDREFKSCLLKFLGGVGGLLSQGCPVATAILDQSDLRIARPATFQRPIFDQTRNVDVI